MSGVELVGVVVGSAAVVTALVVLRKFLWRLWGSIARAHHLLDEIAPVVIAIGEQFKNNGGSSLRDRLDLTLERATHAVELVQQRSDLVVHLQQDLAVLTECVQGLRSDHRLFGNTVTELLERTHGLELSLAGLLETTSARDVEVVQLRTAVTALADLRDFLINKEIA